VECLPSDDFIKRDDIWRITIKEEKDKESELEIIYNEYFTLIIQKKYIFVSVV
jgi:hypothetical protein